MRIAHLHNVCIYDLLFTDTNMYPPNLLIIAWPRLPAVLLMMLSKQVACWFKPGWTPELPHKMDYPTHGQHITTMLHICTHRDGTATAVLQYPQTNTVLELVVSGSQLYTCATTLFVVILNLTSQNDYCCFFSIELYNL